MKRLLLIVCLLACSGCSMNIGFKHYVPVYQRMPIIPKPDKPKYSPLSVEPGESLSDREKQMLNIAHKWQVYSKQLEESVDMYNESARGQNERYKKYFGKTED